MTCEPFCDTCGGNLGHPANGDDTCEKCLRAMPKIRIRKEEFEYNNRSHFALRTRGGGWRYYRKVESDPIIFIGDGQYRRRSQCSPADIERAKLMKSNVNVGLV